MTKTYILSIFLLAGILPGLSQDSSEEFFYNHTFTQFVQEFELDFQMDSLPNYVLTSKKNKYLPKATLNLIHPDSESEFFVLLDRGIAFPHIILSSHVTNLMDNEVEHNLAFYSLDSDFVSEILHADWAVDTQFIPKDQTELTGYARSFYQEKTDLQVTLILLTKDLPLLSTPKEMRALRFRKSKPK